MSETPSTSDILQLSLLESSSRLTHLMCDPDKRRITFRVKVFGPTVMCRKAETESGWSEKPALGLPWWHSG